MAPAGQQGQGAGGLLSELDLQHEDDLVVGALGLHYPVVNGTTDVGQAGAHFAGSADAMHRQSHHPHAAHAQQQYHLQTSLHGLSAHHMPQYATAAGGPEVDMHAAYRLPMTHTVDGAQFHPQDQHHYNTMISRAVAAAAAAAYPSDPSRHPTTAGFDHTTTLAAQSGASGLTAAKLASLPSNVADVAQQPMYNPAAVPVPPMAARSLRRSPAVPLVSAPPEKRRYTRQRPERSAFATDEEYQAAFTRWRERRDKNNKAVRRSRLSQSKGS